MLSTMHDQLYQLCVYPSHKHTPSASNSILNNVQFNIIIQPTIAIAVKLCLSTNKYTYLKTKRTK